MRAGQPYRSLRPEIQRKQRQVNCINTLDDLDGQHSHAIQRHQWRYVLKSATVLHHLSIMLTCLQPQRIIDDAIWILERRLHLRRGEGTMSDFQLSRHG